MMIGRRPGGERTLAPCLVRRPFAGGSPVPLPVGDVEAVIDAQAAKDVAHGASEAAARAEDGGGYFGELLLLRRRGEREEGGDSANDIICGGHDRSGRRARAIGAGVGARRSRRWWIRDSWRERSWGRGGYGRSAWTRCTGRLCEKVQGSCGGSMDMV